MSIEQEFANAMDAEIVEEDGVAVDQQSQDLMELTRVTSGADLTLRGHFNRPVNSLSFADLQGAVTELQMPVIGGTIIWGKGEKENTRSKAELKGVPFFILGAIFRQSVKATEKKGKEKIRARHFVSLEVLTQDDERGVINDGGTGIAASMAGFMLDNRYIAVDRFHAEYVADISDERQCCSTWKINPTASQWVKMDVGEATTKYAGMTIVTFAPPSGAILVAGGLRSSEYKNEHGDGETYYFN